jgi:hypothetical protein
MRYQQRAELRCLKYLRRLRVSVVSPIMRQIDALSVLSRQVKEPVPRLGETPTPMPHIRVPCLGPDETGHLPHGERIWPDVAGGAQQMRQCRLRAVQQAEYVQLQYLLPLRRGCVGHRAEQHHPGVDRRVQAAW